MRHRCYAPGCPRMVDRDYCCTPHMRMLPRELQSRLSKPLCYITWPAAIQGERKELHERAQVFFEDEFKRLLGEGL